MLLIFQGVEAENKEYVYIKEKVSAHPVYMFSKTTCSFCKMAKEVLDGTNFEYTVESIDGRPDMNELQTMLQKITGERTVSREQSNQLIYVQIEC